MISNEMLDQIVTHLVRAKQHAAQMAMVKTQTEASALQREATAYSEGAYDVINYVKLRLAENIKP